MTPGEQDLKEMYQLSRDLLRVSRLFQKENIHCGGVTFLQFTILDFIMENGNSLELSKLHDLLAVEKSTTTRLVQPLIKKKYVQKKNSPNDPRAFRILITKSGESAYNTYWECISKNFANITSVVSKQKLEEIKVALKMYVRAIGSLCGDSCCS